jgi:hypothetical protein
MDRNRTVLPWARKAAASPGFTAILVVLAVLLVVIAAGMVADGPTLSQLASQQTK